MVAFADRQRKTREANRPAINFNQRDDIRDFARSGIGQNYHRMMDLQSQNNPNLQDLKQARRQWNRYDKYNAGNILGRSPTEMQDMFMRDTESFRQANKPAYAKMYPLTSLAMDYGESGGLLGLAIKGLRGDIGKLGKDIAGATGITGAVDDTPEEQDDYVAKTFGFYPSDVHPGLSSIEGPMEQSEVIYSPNAPTYYDRAEGLDFDEDPNQPYVAPDDYVEDDFGAFYTDENTLAPERGLPFDDSAREAGIMSQYPTNFIGPRDDPSRRPDMFDVAGPGINRGLIPYPEYNDNMVYTPQMGRGDLPRYGYDYAGERQAREEEYRLQQLLNSILNQEEDTPQAPPPLSIGATR